MKDFADVTSNAATNVRPERAASSGNAERQRITVHGIVQGVGFRPFVNRLARTHSLAGTVNNFTGGVSIEIEGPAGALEAFVEDLRRNPPPIAVIEDVQVEAIPATGQTEFVITRSAEAEGGPIFVSPDVAICADCARELGDPSDRRFRHPFINCTNCGPRFTIIRRVPYDRPFTSMASFEMCAQCAREYGNIDDRRYHAQPVACPQCGPRVEVVCGPDNAVRRPDNPVGPRPSGMARQDCRAYAGEEGIREAQQLLGAGQIVAIKGLGGFHLACDAANEEAVARLRQRKGREEKPFAVMVASMDVARRIAHITEDAARLLTSPQAPIVLAAKNSPDALALSVAPDSADYGILLPYTPLHLLLIQDAPFEALIMTSGNLSDEPLCTGNDEALARLGGIADAFLLHDREILVGCDDSVVRTSSRGPIIMRRARGYVPFPVKLGRQVKPVLAVGAQLKNTFCMTSGDNAFLSQHIGDLDDLKSLEFFERSVAHFEDILQVRPEIVACDLHPDYLATRYAQRLAGESDLPLIETQHHHAHIVSCMADNHHSGEVIGLACDGTGLGTDGTIWGCEVLLCDHADFERLGHLRYVPLPGGDAAVRQPWRSALAYLWACGLTDQARWLREAMTASVSEDEWATVEAMLERSVNCPPASSAGRLFDAVAAMLGLRARTAYEGQAAIGLEAAVTPTGDTYRFSIEGQEAGPSGSPTLAAGLPVPHGNDQPSFIMDPAPILSGVVADIRAGVSVGEIAGRFHNTFAEMLAECATRAAEAHGVEHVALSGGTFQNRILLGRLCDILEQRGLAPLYHKSVPPNDGGLALGQALIADARASG